MKLLIFLYAHLDVLTEQFHLRDGFKYPLCEPCIPIKGYKGQQMRVVPILSSLK